MPRRDSKPEAPTTRRAEHFISLPPVKAPVELMTYLVEQAKISRNKAKALLTHRAILVNNTIVTQYNHELRPGMTVQISKERNLKDFKSKFIRLVYEDPYIIVVDKHEGIAVVDNKHKREQTVLQILTDYIQRSGKQRRIYGVHKLDQQASGLMVFAKDERTKQNLQDNWTRLFNERTLVAVVEGEMEKDAGVVSSWLSDGKVYVVQAAPARHTDEKAVTYYTTIKRAGGYSLVELEMRHGRKEQTRAHMHDIGHPIVGEQEGQNPIKRLALHAFRLNFRHPVTGETMIFETPYPTLFRNLVKRNTP